MAWAPDEFADGAEPVLHQISQTAVTWTPVCHSPVAFTPSHFLSVMANLLRNPNNFSSWLFRADILSQSDGSELPQLPSPVELPVFRGFVRTQTVVRTLVPRNLQRDKPLDQTCLSFESADPDERREPHETLVVYMSHVASEAEVPFYHPKVRGIAYLHTWNPQDALGKVSIHYALFHDDEMASKLRRTALNLMTVLCKHGEGVRTGYVKRVQHDTLISQARVQDTYQNLKKKYARSLVTGWLESTDPNKHVFEDLGIAAFLMELWKDMYGSDPFPGFVDIGCGNGLLVHLLNREGYRGWGFDARSRKSWLQYGTKLDSGLDSLRQLVLLPSTIVVDSAEQENKELAQDRIHDGKFPEGTFIISNHADELTPWTPILAAASGCPFLSIPCCSHRLTGARFRAPAPKDKTKPSSTYGSLVEWVADIGSDCGWQIEREALRIPSTRNLALVGRHRVLDGAPVGLSDIVAKYGGAEGYADKVINLVATKPRSH